MDEATIQERVSRPPERKPDGPRPGIGPGAITGIAALSREMAAGRQSAAQLVEEALARIEQPGGEGPRAFVKVWAQEARATAAAQDALRKMNAVPSPIAGIPLSIKDLFDVKGDVTLAGTKALDDAPPATAHAPIVQRLNAAGAVLIGRTNMTQFAASAVGTNPYTGTPGNPWDRKRTPGGSSSGAAVCVADGMATVAIGSDTVGSIRVPAALCGVVGFKPTQGRVSRAGAIPLSPTLDSVGPLARNVDDCALIDAVLAGEEIAVPNSIDTRGLRIAIAQGHVLEDLVPQVARSFERACTALSQAGGALLSDQTFDAFAEIHDEQMNSVIQYPEAFAWHEKLLARRGDDYDPFVRGRVEQGKAITASHYIRIIRRRLELMQAFDHDTEEFDAVIMPTVPIIAPTISECLQADTSLRTMLIRNPLLFNVLDRCSISLPVHRPGEAPVGLMIVGKRNGDRRLFGIARTIEALLAP
jgi:aspartyl-tRNA(Asn)/glutamyl-tRNA(Gln) amidotransferase subunit A